ncbi:MAG TPA: polysaccharide biosynthesis protein, partial [Bacteroidales bacterium]|nr:polysaccharide biosynthesis protein [Bacteroidales bacterium]
ANVAFSDGSLLHGFNQRIQKQQPIVAPNDVKRYFVTPKESGELCLMSAIFGENRDIFFPKLSENLHLITFSEIAVRYLKALGYEPYLCQTENEARSFFENDRVLRASPEWRRREVEAWPCLFTPSDTTGEKDFEEFYTDQELLDMVRFHNLGIIKNQEESFDESLDYFSEAIQKMKAAGKWTKQEIVDVFAEMIPGFEHKDVGRYLDSKM